MPRAPLAVAVLAAAALALTTPPAEAQWTNRYPAVPGYGHHVYLEGFNLPTASAGLTDPAPSPDGRALAFASRGWLWLLDLESGRARRLTSGPAIDARPAWSPDGRALVFVRDDTRETWIVRLELDGGAETVVADAPGLELDPAFTPDGRAVLYAAAGAEGIGLRLADLEAGTSAVVTDARGLALAPRPHPDGEHVLYLAKGGADEVRLGGAGGEEELVVYRGAILSQTRPALAPDGQAVALSVPRDDGWDLVLADLDAPTSTVRLVTGPAPALEPAWSPDGAHLYYAQADASETMRLWRVPVEGGTPTEVAVEAWDWGVPLGALTVRTTIDGTPAPARLSITDADGHPVFPDGHRTWFDGQTGAVYFYSPGEITVRAPVGTLRVAAVQGLETPLATVEATTDASGSTSVALPLTPVWDGDGWLSGDQHFHLNYGGPYALDLADIRPVLAGEGLGVGTPLVANLHTRYVDDERWGESLAAEAPILSFGQEVRSHFFGHVGLVGTQSLFDPWIWGPGYEVYGRDDRANAEVTAHARREGGIATYVHPIGDRDPFAPDGDLYAPALLVADGVLGDLDGLEVVCLWTDDLGTSEVWYRLLNLGRPVVPMAGSDVMSNFYRTMAPGTARAYVRSEPSIDAYLAELKAGRSFVTTGPLLDVEIGGARPGGTVASGRVEWTARLASAVPVDRIEVVVNGRVVETLPGLERPGQRTVRGVLTLPEAGWVAVRAVGDEPQGWPSMAAYPFAHTAPVWIGTVGSVDPTSERQSARDLLRLLDASEARFEAAYAGVEAPTLRERYRRARAELDRRAGQ